MQTKPHAKVAEVAKQMAELVIQQQMVQSPIGARTAAVHGSSKVSSPKTQEIYQISPALKPAAPEDGRIPLNRYFAE